MYESGLKTYYVLRPYSPNVLYKFYKDRIPRILIVIILTPLSYETGK